MSKGFIIMLIVLAVMIIAMVVLAIVGNKMQKKQAEQREMMKEAAQLVTMLIIDKKIMKMKDAGLPKQVIEQTPKRFRSAKVPIVKAKAGPQTLNLLCDDAVFDELPTKCEVKAMVSGIYITEIKSVRGNKKRKQQAEAPKKKTWGQKLREKQRKLQNEMLEEEKNKEANKKKKEDAKKKADQAKKITK